MQDIRSHKKNEPYSSLLNLIVLFCQTEAMEPKKLNITTIEGIINTHLTHEDKMTLILSLTSQLTNEYKVAAIKELTKDMRVTYIDPYKLNTHLIDEPYFDEAQIRLSKSDTLRSIYKHEGKYNLIIDGWHDHCPICDSSACKGHDELTDDEWLIIVEERHTIFEPIEGVI
jgi:hypothetical protein